MNKPTMHTDPILLPAALATLLVVVAIPVGVAWLTDMPVKAALATALLALSPLLVANVHSRRRVSSPATVANLVATAFEQGALATVAAEPPANMPEIMPTPVKKVAKKATAAKKRR